MIRSPTPLLNTKLKELPKNTTKRDLTVTGRLVNDFGASETVQLALVAPGADGSEGGAVDHWRKRVSPRLNMDRARDALETTEQIGAQLLTPDDSKWPEEMNILGDHAPLALWVLGNAEHLSAEASVGIIGARAATGYGSHVAGELADGVAEQGQVVVSGGSYGIDAVGASCRADGRWADRRCSPWRA